MSLLVSEIDRTYTQIAADYELNFNSDLHCWEYDVGRHKSPAEPTIAHDAIHRAMVLARIDPKHKISERALPENGTDDVIDMFVRMLNSRLLDHTEVADDMTFTCGIKNLVAGFCSDAEPNFAEALASSDRTKGIRHKLAKDYLGPIAVFVNEAGEPLFFKKYLDEATALALQPFSLSGVTHPAGTITAVWTKNEADRADDERIGFKEPLSEEGLIFNGLTECRNPLRIISVGQISHLGPGRVSMYAHADIQHRMTFVFEEGDDYVSQYRAQLAKLSIDTFREGVSFATSKALAA